ncbi:hypothetical protein Tco_1271633, partial [Tanacetum coccineum]
KKAMAMSPFCRLISIYRSVEGLEKDRDLLENSTTI